MAALDRQHPRDIFDIKFLLDNSPYDTALQKGVLFCLLSSKRPLDELLNPLLPDHRKALETQFGGMSDHSFTYEMFEATRHRLVDTVRKGLTDHDCTILLSFARGDPSWVSHDFSRFPGVQWKLYNINLLKNINPSKHKMQLDKLVNTLSTL